MIEITDKRLTNDTLVGDLRFGDTCMYKGELIQRVDGSNFNNQVSTQCTFVVISTGSLVYIDSEQKVQQVSITIEVHNL